MELINIKNPVTSSVLIVDNHASVRSMISNFLRLDDRFSVIGETHSGIEGLRLFREFTPSLVVMELELPEMNGPEMLREIRQIQPDARLLVYSGTTNLLLIQTGLETLPQGFVHKTEPLEVFGHAATMVAQGFSFFSPYASRLMHEKKGFARQKDPLTPRERTIVQLIAEGKSTKEAAGLLALSPKTVEHYRKNLMRKLGIDCVATLTIYAIRNGLIRI